MNHITSSPPHSQSNWLAEKYGQIVKNLFYAKEEGTDLYKSLMIYRSTPLSYKLQSPMQILESQTARTQLPMSSTTRIEQGLGSEQLRVNNKNQHLPTHDYHIGQSVMYLNPINKRWYPAKIRSLCQEPRSYKIETDDGTTYRRTQNHLKLFQHKTDKKDKDDIWTIKNKSKMSKGNNNIQIRPKHKIKLPVKLNL